MKILKKLFSNSSKTSVNKKINKQTIIYKSEMPEYIDAANKIYKKEYDSAIEDLKKQLNKTSKVNYKGLSMVHINLMQAYFRNRATHPEYFDRSTYHAKEALKYGHNTGLAAFRLIVNLEKRHKVKQAIEVCNIVTDKNYKFSIYGYKQKDEFVERLKKLEIKLKNSGDNNTEHLFTDKEKKMTIENSIKNK
ncbi:MAG: hypothetical protein RAP70_01455 [Candidatus Celaenobacter antarcticus]|nr:hypothetical protein [Candidatus Celaenobacter antarcticus]